MSAVNKDNFWTTDKLLARDAKVDFKNSIGQTALMFAARYGNVEMATKLLTANPKINSKDNNGVTALMFAAEKICLALLLCC